MHAPRHAPAQRRPIWPPEPGYFVLGLVRGGWRVPARIIFDPGVGWQAEVDGVLHPAHPDPAHAYMVDAIWHGGTRVDEADYDWFTSIKEWAQDNDPAHPSLHPRQRIDPRLLKPLVHHQQ